MEDTDMSQNKSNKDKIKTIYFVIGPSGAGKSTYIKKHFKNADVVDLFDCQQRCLNGRKYITIQDIVSSYDDCAELLSEAVSKHLHDTTDVVLEHTLLKDFRRYQYIKAARDAGAVRIKAICIVPDKETYKRNLQKRWNEFDINEASNDLDLFEIPEVNGSGFDGVEIVRD